MPEATTKLPAPILELRHQLESRKDDLTAALPKKHTADFFNRVVINAVARKPSLLKADRRSLLVACMNAAVDGLLPDGREGALVEYWDERNKVSKVQWQPMALGFRMKIRQSGEIDGVECNVVYANDEFYYQLGDEPKLVHRPALDDPGPMVRVYSIARFKSGYVTREVMSRAQVEKIRDRSNAWRGAVKNKKTGSTSWGTDFEEMARKTVLRRHAKQLPMNRDVERLLGRDDVLFSEEALKLPPPAKQRLTTDEGLARIAGNGQDVDDVIDEGADGPEIEAEVVETSPAPKKAAAKKAAKPEPEADDAFPGDTPADSGQDNGEDGGADESDNDGELSQAEQDFRQGEDDFANNIRTCSVAAIKADRDRLQRWQAGWKAAWQAQSNKA